LKVADVQLRLRSAAAGAVNSSKQLAGKVPSCHGCIGQGKELLHRLLLLQLQLLLLLLLLLLHGCYAQRRCRLLPLLVPMPVPVPLLLLHTPI
jgi:hypothetical protein